METNRKRRINAWQVAFFILLAIVVVAVMFPVFSKARSRGSLAMMHTYEEAGGGYGGEAKSRADYTPAAPAPARAAQTVAWRTARAATIPRMVISTADVSVEVPDVQKTHEQIVKIADRADGFVTRSNITGYDGRKTASITVRVPAKQYQKVLADIAKLGKVLSKEEKGEDVTEEYVDLQSRIRNLKREEDAFLAVLKKANKVPEILQVERELSRVRGEIEQATGRIQFLQNQVALATISVQLKEPAPAVMQVVSWNVSRTAVRAFHALQVVFRNIASLAIWAVVFIPLWALLGVVRYGYKRYSRRRAS